MKNPFGRRVEQPWEDNAYATYTAPGFVWKVLKTYQHPDNEGSHATWLFATQGPGTFGSWEIGDGYAEDVKAHGTLIHATEAWQEHYGAPVEVVLYGG